MNTQTLMAPMPFQVPGALVVPPPAPEPLIAPRPPLIAPRPPKAVEAAAPVSGKDLDDGMIQWLAENRLRNCAPSLLLDVMVRTGVDRELGAAALEALDRDPVFLAALANQQMHRKLESVVGNLQSLWASSPSYDEIERRDSVPHDEFVERYVRGCRPVILTAAARDWPALAKWTPQYLKTRFGDHEVEIQGNRNSDRNFEPNKNAHKQRVMMSDFVDRVVAGGPTNDYYLTANNELLMNPAFAPLLEDIGTLPSLCNPNALAGSSSLWFGPAGTNTWLHHDTLMLFHTHVYGRKRWRFLSPLETPNLYNFNLFYSLIDLDAPDTHRFPRFANAKVIEVVVEPGETVFLPLGWWHQVTSLDVCISFNFSNLAIPNRFDYVHSEISTLLLPNAPSR
ncbi:MAG: hypothetical protein K0Q43_59 [Ramlibacter sp.]|jgi:hypothetical protein|nr:hypothetical protein [Ramlibacter sp.]